MQSILFLVIFFLGSVPSLAFAHVLEKDGTIGAVIHITPDDNPIVGKPSEFFFEFKDTTGKFTPSECDCTVTVLQNGKTIYTQPLLQNTTDPSLQNASFSFTFPQKDIYTITLKGKPLSDNTFEPFTLSYDLRVTRENGEQKGSSQSWFSVHLIHLIGGFLLLGFVIIAYIRQQREKGEVKKK